MKSPSNTRKEHAILPPLPPLTTKSPLSLSPNPSSIAKRLPLTTILILPQVDALRLQNKLIPRTS